MGHFEAPLSSLMQIQLEVPEVYSCLNVTLVCSALGFRNQGCTSTRIHHDQKKTICHGYHAHPFQG